MRRFPVCALAVLFAAPLMADTYTTLAPTGTPPTQRMGHSATRQPSPNRLVVFGGGTIDIQNLTVATTNDTFSLSLAAGSESWTQLNPAGPPSARMLHSAVYDSTRDRVLLFGGVGSSLTTNNELWELTLTPGSEAWRQMTPVGVPTVPPARFAHAAVYVPSTDQMIVFGGYTGTFPTIIATNDIWALTLNSGDGTWTPVGIGGAPASAGHQIAYDSANNRLLLFGVGDLINQSYSNDVYVRDFPLAINNWQQLTPPAPLPTQRQGFAQMYDVTTDPSLPRWLVLGGGQLDIQTGSGDYPGDGYVFESVPGSERWVALVPTNNSVRTGLWTAVHDTASSRLVLFGGLNGGGFSNATTALSLGSNYDPRLVSATPNTGMGGRNVIVTLTGSGTAWANGTSSANFGPEIQVNSTTVTSPTSATVDITIMGSAFAGPRNVGVITGTQTDSAIGLFTVVNPLRNILAGQGLADPNPNVGSIFDSGGGPLATMTAYGAGKWGLNVAADEIDGDGKDEVVTGPGPGAVFGPQVRAFEETGTAKAKVNYYAYGTLKYGVNVGGADVERDGFTEIVTGAGEGAVFGPHVRGWNFDNAAVTAISKINFFAYNTLKYGAKVVGADLDFDGYGELITAPGPGAVFGPQIHGYNVDGGAVTALNVNFFAFSGVQFGANLSGADVDIDGHDEILVAKGPSGGAAYDTNVRGFNHDGATVTAIANLDFTAYLPSTLYGARVGAGSFAITPGDEILTGPGPDPAMTSTIHEYGYNAVSGETLVGQFDAFAGQMYGVNVVGGNFGY